MCNLKKVFAVCFVSSAWLAQGATIEKGTRLEFDAVLPEKENLTLSFGRGLEKLTVISKANGYAWRYSDPTGENPQKRGYPGSTSPREKMTYWWENCDYTPNGRYKRTFSIPHGVGDICEYLQSERWQTPTVRRLAFAVELVDGYLAFYVDDILLHALPATADVAGKELAVRSSRGATVSEVKRSSVVSAPGWYRVPLGKVATSAGNPAADRTMFGDVPFLASSRSVDLARSWVREACVSEYGAPNNGTFGGRWAGALSATPTRLQFRVPNRRYEAMYLLASCTNNNFLTVQFYRPGSGFPVDCVPAEPISADGKLQLIRVPLRQDKLAAFADREILEFELTGRVENYRAHPEPSHYSRHGVGEPSGVLVHAISLKESPLEIDFTPEALGNVWVGMNPSPAYRLKLANRAGSDCAAEVTLETKSYDGKSALKREYSLTVPGKDSAEIRIDVPVKKFGWHSAKLTVNGVPYERSLVVLRPRRYESRPFEAPGLMFGCWPVGMGVHFSLPAYDACSIAFKLGIEAFSFKNLCKQEDIAPLAKQYGVKDFGVATLNTGRPTGYLLPDLEEQLRKTATPESDVSDPSYQNLFAEPGGIGTQASITALCGVPPPPRTPAQEEKYLFFKTNLVRFAEIYRRAFPGKKLMLPWGSPLFTVAYLQDPDTRHLFDGMSFDTAFFDRLPEGQLHSCSLYVLTLLNREWSRYRKDKPLLVSVEGPCISRTAPESLTAGEFMRNMLRCNFILSANGVTRLLACISAGAECASYWGEQHYSGGGLSRLTLNPYPSYAACGTMIRHLRDCEFKRVVPTPSLGIFVLEYANIKTGEPLHVMWTVRGKVPFKAKFRQLFDAMDNVNFPSIISPEPIFMIGCKGDIEFGRQTFDVAETKPEKGAVKVSSLAVWKQSTETPPKEYLENMPGNIIRFPVEMNVTADAGKLSVCLPDGLPDCDAMPFCTTIVPPKSVVLPGRPRVIALEVETEADWGRVVYELKDAEGERFISVGQESTYNVDDTKCDSFFNFSGRRIVRFELPGNRPWDASRYPGSCWWGAYGGNGRVDYPLSLEKIYVERRPKAMHVNALVDVKITPVKFGSLYVERIEPAGGAKMSPPPKGVKRQNPLAEIVGTLPATEITGVTHPLHYYDGTRGHFAFGEMPEAAGYDIYVSLTPTGEGSILLGRNLKASGELVKGFLAGRDHYAFIVWRNKKGEVSKPSKPFKFMLKDEFAEK